MNNHQKVQSVVAAHQVLEALAAKSEGSSLAELARALDMTPSRVLRHLVTLLELQLVERTGAEPVYRLGVGLVRLAERAAMQHDVGRVAFPALRRLSDTFGQATFLVRRQDMRALVWLSFQSNGVPHLTMPPGMSFSLTGSACGRVLLAFDGEHHKSAPLGPEPAQDFPDPMPSREALEERLESIRHSFFDHYGSDMANALYGLSVPILDHEDRAVAGIGIVGLSVYFPPQAQALLSAVLACGAEISRQLGSRRKWPTAPLRAIWS